MWTPKRILLLVLGFTLFLGCYIVYAVFLGGIDGLPPLPPGYAYTDDPPPLPPRPAESEVDRKLRLAFGQECHQVHKPYRLENRKKRLVLAFETFNTEPDGRLKLTPFSVAMFAEPRKDQPLPEINTIESDFAYLTFDQPVANLTEISSRKIVAGELVGKIHIVNNRHTSSKNDDLEIRIDEKETPLYYDEAKNKIWTLGIVKLWDFQSQPHPTTVIGTGMDLLLAQDSGPAKKADKGSSDAAKPRNRDASGVDQVILHEGVQMCLYPDSDNSLLGSPREPARPCDPPPSGPAAGQPQPAASPTPKKKEKVRVHITSPGKFIFDLVRDVATFECVEGPKLCDQVHVVREPLAPADEAGKLVDQLYCDFLRLNFRRKPSAPTAGAAPDKGAGDREIDSAYAQGRPERPLDEQVTLSIDSENLHAFCTELFYDSPTPTRGPRVRLTGKEVVAVKDAHKIFAKELFLLGADKDGNGQYMTATGPGQVDLFDRNNLKNTHPVHALWKDLLVFTKDKQGNQVYDLLTLTRDASFIDDEHAQELHGQRLKVWLEPADKGTPANDSDQKQTASTAPRQRPWKVEAVDEVRAKSPELIIHWCRILTIMFEDGIVPLPAELPVPANVANGLGPPPVAPAPQFGAPVPPVPGAPVVAGSSPKDTGPPAQAKPEEKKPIHLWARDVTSYVTRLGPKNELREMVAEGTVRVRQEGKVIQDKDGRVVLDKEGKPAKEKGVDIKGEILTVNRQVGGDVLKVFGDTNGPAQLQLNDLYLEGPKVEIDQVKNTAYVQGPGAMSLPSNTSIEGGKPARPGARLVVHWTRDMLFNGQDADYTGAVVANQDDSSLRCKTLQVKLDKFIAFKEGQKGGEGAKAEKMVANGSAYVVDVVYDKEGPDGQKEMVQTSRVLGHQIDSDNKEGVVRVPGPGRVIQIKLNKGDDADAAPRSAAGKPAPPPKKAEEEWKLTHVTFEDLMFSNNKSDPRVTRFWGDVRVFHVPVKKEERFEAMDWGLEPDRLPKGSMYIRSGYLEVLTRPGEKGKNNQEMMAKKNVTFKMDDFFGNTDTLYYDEKEDRVTLVADPGNTVKLYRRERPGLPAKLVQGRRFIYYRKTGAFLGDDLRAIQFGRAELPRAAGSVAIARLHADRQDEALAAARVQEQVAGRQDTAALARLDEGEGAHHVRRWDGRFGVVAGDERQELAADAAVDNFLLPGRRDAQADLVVLVSRLVDNHLNGGVLDQRNVDLLVDGQRL